MNAENRPCYSQSGLESIRNNQRLARGLHIGRVHSGNTPGYLVYTWISPDARHETVLMMNEDPKTVGDAANAAYYALLHRAFCER